MGALRRQTVMVRASTNRRMVAGDPGFFGSVGSILGSIGTGLLAGGIPGAIVGGAAGLAGVIGAPKPSTPAVPATPAGPTLPQLPSLSGPVQGSGAIGTGIGGTITLPGGISVGGGLSLGGAAGQFGTALAPPNQPETAIVGSIPPRGYHLNKHAYFLKNGTHVAARSKWVRNRSRNPLNPHALRHSTSRLMGFEHAVKRVEKALNKLSSGRRRPARARAHRESCGCATCRAA